MDESKSLSHTRWECKYHVVFIPTPAQDWVEWNGKALPRESPEARFFASIYDLGDGEVDFPGCHHILKDVKYRGWICVDLDSARRGPLISYQRSGTYIGRVLEPIYL